MFQLQNAAANDLSSLAAIVAGVSLATERLVTAAKTALPQLLANEETKPGTQQPDLVADRGRRLLVQLIAFLSAFLTSTLIATKTVQIAGLALPFYVVYGGAEPHLLPTPFLALFAMGGSAFWTSVVAYASAAKDIQTQTAVAQATANNARLNGERVNGEAAAQREPAGAGAAGRQS